MPRDLYIGRGLSASTITAIAGATRGLLRENVAMLKAILQGPPAVGREVRSLEYAGRRWWLLQEISSTSDPGLLRVTLWLAPGAGPGRAAEIETAAVQRLVGFLGVAR